jgi:uncharacterized protein GlcG (DUF336 family)
VSHKANRPIEPCGLGRAPFAFRKAWAALRMKQESGLAALGHRAEESGTAFTVHLAGTLQIDFRQ